MSLREVHGADVHWELIFPPAYTQSQSLPKYLIPEETSDPTSVYRLIHDTLKLDGIPTLNLATFVNSVFMDPQAEKLMDETRHKNFIDQQEYPQTKEIEHRCVNMLGNLFHANGDQETPIGSSTIGSSEACMLGGLAMKRRWQEKNPHLKERKPNLVLCQNVHAAWLKFIDFFEVEPHFIDLTPSRFTIDPAQVANLCDEYTIGVVTTLGLTYTGHFEDIKEVDRVLEIVNSKNRGWDIGIHIDAASGGFIAPFVDPEFVWDFRLKWVKSINVSGHKFGFVYPGIGWVIWRDAKELPQSLILKMSYLGEEQSSFTLNFSKPANQIIGQYYNLLRLGRKGYTDILVQLRQNTRFLKEKLECMNLFRILSPVENGVTMIAATLKHPDDRAWNLHDLSDILRRRGWQIPVYPLAKGAENILVMRIVQQHTFSREMAGLLVGDVEKALTELEKNSHGTKQEREVPLPQKSHGFA